MPGSYEQSAAAATERARRNDIPVLHHEQRGIMRSGPVHVEGELWPGVYLRWDEINTVLADDGRLLREMREQADMTSKL